MSLQSKMNEYLANQEMMYLKLHNLHWYVEGSSFFTLHAKFEELYDRTADIIDEVAERMLALDMKPAASLKKALELGKVKELSDEAISCADSVQKLISDVEFWVRDSAEISKMADSEEDAITADLFRNYQQEYEKLLWMLKALQK